MLLNVQYTDTFVSNKIIYKILRGENMTIKPKTIFSVQTSHKVFVLVSLDKNSTLKL